MARYLPVLEFHSIWSAHGRVCPGQLALKTKNQGDHSCIDIPHERHDFGMQVLSWGKYLPRCLWDNQTIASQLDIYTDSKARLKPPHTEEGPTIEPNGAYSSDLC